MTSAKKQPIFIPHNGRFVPAIPEKPEKSRGNAESKLFMRKSHFIPQGGRFFSFFPNRQKAILFAIAAIPVFTALGIVRILRPVQMPEYLEQNKEWYEKEYLKDLEQIKPAKSHSIENMVWIPGGSFLMGGKDAQTLPDARGLHRVFVSGFWMDENGSDQRAI
ncbi:MAG: hypothetical protein IPK21_19580 [Haliscomenobacter sp.]|nr:hypothetical protein [Haliscomenobacter sp.]